MRKDEIDTKLAFIARLTADELHGWVWARQYDKRPLFDGEQAALTERAKRLGVNPDGSEQRKKWKARR